MKIARTGATLATTAFAALCISGIGMPGAANADTTHGDGSALSGNQIDAPISVPVNICGNAIALLGQAAASCHGGASVDNNGPGHHGGGSHVSNGPSHDRSSGRGGALSGNQVHAPISVPVNICGNSVAVAGQATAHCGSHGHRTAPPTSAPPTTAPPTTAPPTSAPPTTPPSTVPPSTPPASPTPSGSPTGHPGVPPQGPGGPKVPASHSLPFTGSNTVGLLAAAAAALVAAAGSLVVARRLRLGRR